MSDEEEQKRGLWDNSHLYSFWPLKLTYQKLAS